MATTVLIVDDQPGFRSRARRFLESEGYQILGEAPDGATALALAQELRPDLVLLDVQLPDISGLEVAQRLADQPAPPAVVLTSTRDAADFGELVSHSGARGFVPKSDLSGPALAELLA